MEIDVFCDGGSRGNPGPAAVGFVIQKSLDGKILVKQGKTIGFSTNNVAEYRAVITALEWLKENLLPHSVRGEKINFFLDSQLVVNQLNGLFKIKNAALRKLFFEIRKLEQEIGGIVSYRFVPREQNFIADSLVNAALDKKVFHII